MRVPHSGLQLDDLVGRASDQHVEANLGDACAFLAAPDRRKRSHPPAERAQPVAGEVGVVERHTLPERFANRVGELVVAVRPVQHAVETIVRRVQVRCLYEFARHRPRRVIRAGGTRPRCLQPQLLYARHGDATRIHEERFVETGDDLPFVERPPCLVIQPCVCMQPEREAEHRA